jgi:prepilin-type processing-associated H-X9-DG protein
MNAAIGDGTKTTEFPWLKFHARKMGDLLIPGPSDSWLFTDEHPDSIDDAILYSNPGSTNGVGQFTELPSSDHGGSCGIGFADGHAEVHRWRDPRTVRGVTYATVQRISIGTFSIDLAWIAAHTPRGH